MSVPQTPTIDAVRRRSPRELMVIVWAPEEQRTESIARMLGAEIFHVHYLKYKSPLHAPFKYPLQALRTWLLLVRYRPRFVYVTNPPIFAPMAVYAWCCLSGAKLIMDTHPPSLYHSNWAWSVPLQRWMSRRVLANISDQDRFKRRFESWGAAPTIVFERPPKVVGGSGVATTSAKPGTFPVAVVNTFAEDEPLQCVLDAARLRPDVTFYITGDTAKGDRAMIAGAPANCVFTGYLRGDAYWGMLRGCRAVMALTEWQNSLMLAAQDGISLGKPTLTSRQQTLMEYFYKGAVFVENTGASIAEGIREVQEREQDLIREGREFVEERQRAWDVNFRQLQKLIDGEPNAGTAPAAAAEARAQAGDAGRT
jgi:hypothetical protein